MATAKDAQAVKSLNTAGGKRNRRFVFKTFSERIDETEIDVFRSLDPLKAEPSGSSFFIDCLIQWRELNTADDFISFYDEVMPLAQSLPLLIIHKELIFSKLHSRLHMKARLSLEPILRLAAELSRDLLEDFIHFLPIVAESFLNLLKDGADREPEIVEQIFTAWSYMMMYLQKYVTQDVNYLLKITRKLRYYPKDFVQEFMAEAISFLLRNAPTEQLRKGIMKLLLEVARNPSQHSLHSVSSVLWLTMRGSSSKFHSRARTVLVMLISPSVLNIQDSKNKEICGVQAVSTTFQRLCMELNQEELQLMWDCLYQEIDHSLMNSSTTHLSHLLSVLISIVSFQKGRKVSDTERLLNLCGLLIETFMKQPCDDLIKDQLSEVGSKILDLILCILDGSHRLFAVRSVFDVSLDWASAFQSGDPGILTFLKELLQKDPSVLSAFQNSILSVCSNLIRTSKEEAIYLLLSLSKRLPLRAGSPNAFEAQSNELVSKISDFLQEEIRQWKVKINKLRYDKLKSGELHDTELSLLWGIICCYPHFVNGRENVLLLIDLAEDLRHLCSAKDSDQEKLSCVESGDSEHNLQSLVGACLRSFQKLSGHEKCELGHTIKILDLAKEYKSSPHVLCSVADYLDALYGRPVELSSMDVQKCLDLNIKELTDIEEVYADNMLNPDKRIRVSTLKILCHYESHAAKWLKSCHPGENEVLSLLLLIEETPITLQHSRKLTLLVSKIQTKLVAGRVSKFHIRIILTGIIGVLFNQFRDLSSCALDCLAILLEKYSASVWDNFVTILRCFQFELEKAVSADSDDKNGSPDLEPSHPVSHEENESSAFKQNANEKHNFSDSVSDEDNSNVNAPNEGSKSMSRSSEALELSELYHSYVQVKRSGRSLLVVVPLLLQALQKIPSVVEARSKNIVPLFFEFLGYSDCVPPRRSKNCGARDWTVILLEWLELLKMMKNPGSFSDGKHLKEILVYRFLDDNDAEVQEKVLDCLLKWKDDFLLPYNKHLKNLICSKTLREELTTWSLSQEAHLIDDGHRKELVPYIIRLLMPKIRNLKTLASRKHASMSSRRAVIGFISQLDSRELPLFFALLLKPFQTENIGDEAVADSLWGEREITEDEFDTSDFMRAFCLQNILNLPWKKICGFLHVVEDILAVFVFDEKRVKFLQLLTECVVRILYSCYFGLFCTRENRRAWLGSDTVSIKEDDTFIGSSKQLKELRTLCLKIISTFLHRYHDINFSSEFWTLFFVSVKHLIHGLKDQGSTSEKPNLLFSCVLAMSQSHSLVTLLCRESNLVEDIFSLLSVKSASESVHRYVFKFTENLLDLAVENKDSCYVRDEGNTARNVILTNLKALISNLRGFFYLEQGQKSKLVRHPGETVMRVLKLLSDYVTDPSTAEDFVDILLPIVQNGAKNSDMCKAALQVMVNVIPVLGDKKVSCLTVNVVAPLLVTAEPDLRSSVCDLLSALAEIERSLLSTAELVRELNATSDMDIDDLDDGVKGYAKITPTYISGVAEDHAVVILSHCIHDMCSEELMLRNSAYNALLVFVKFLAGVIGQAESYQSISGEQTMEVDRCHWTRACAQRFINKFLLRHVGHAMNEGSSVQKVWLDLLREMVCELSELPSLKSLKLLCSDNPEEDFFYNITHIQIRSRARAMTRFAHVVATGKLCGDMTKRVFIPLFFGILLGLDDGKWEHVRAACMNAIASSSGQMSWKPYSELLSRCFRDMAKRPGKRKVLLRLICSVLDNFHFMETCAANDGKELNDNDVHTEVPDPPARYSGALDRADIESFLQQTVLPKLQDLLVSDSESMNIDVSLTALKVLKLLPAGILESQLPSIIQRITNFLKSRLESIRDGARSALAACFKELGVGYLRFIVKALRASLRRGFELHVLGYTLNYVLSKCPPKNVGDLDYCLNDLLIILENDILGDVAQEKEVEKIASKMKETRKRMSFETLELVAANVTFQVHAKRLVSSVTAHMHTHMTSKMKSKLETMLEHLAIGVERNPSANPKDLFTFIYCLINDGIAGENSNGGSSSATIVKGQTAGDQTQKRSYCAGGQPQGQHLVTGFALRLFHTRIKTGKLVNGDQLISFLDPFVNLFSVCLDSKHEEIITASLRCIFHLVKLPLPSLDSQADKIKVTLLDIAQNSSNASSPIMETCLRLLTELLQSSKVTLSREQLNMLIQFPIFVDLEKNPSFVLLSLLKAIVRRKLVAPKIYDLASTVAELMVTSQSGPIRNRCSQILLQFLMKYELSEERLEKHLNDLIVNVERYEHATGREAVLEMISAIIRKSPQQFADKWSWVLFIILINRLVHDPDSQVRSLVGAAIQLLVSRVGPASLDIILRSTFSWYLDANERLWSAAAQVLGLLVEVLKESFRKHISKVFLLPAKEGSIRMKSVLHSAVEASRQLDITEQSAIPYWKEAYYSLVLFQKIVGIFPEFFFRKDVEYIWGAIIELLMHPHLWIRSISSRLVASCFEQTSKLILEDKVQVGMTYHTRLDRLFTMAVSQCCHLKGKLSDDRAVEIAKNNLVFACWGIHMLRESKESRDVCAFWSVLNSDEQRRFVEAAQLLVSGKKRVIIASVMPTSQEPHSNASENENEKKNFCKLLLSCLLETMGKFAQQVEDHQTKAFLNSFDLFALKIGLRNCEPYAYELLHPLHRLCEGFSGKVISEDVKHQAEEVLGRIRGMDNYSKVSSEIKRNRRTKSSARKQKEKVMAVVDPQRRAKRKLRAAEKHKAHKKRKIMSMKMGRWMR